MRANDAMQLLLDVSGKFRIALEKDRLTKAIFYNNLNNAYRALNNYDKAIFYLGESLAIKENEFGKNNPIISITITNLGLTYLKIGRVAEACDLLIRAYNLDSEFLNEKHPLRLKNYMGLCYDYISKEDHENASKYYRLAADLFDTKSQELEELEANISKLQVNDNDKRSSVRIRSE